MIWQPVSDKRREEKVLVDLFMGEARMREVRAAAGAWTQAVDISQTVLRGRSAHDSITLKKNVKSSVSLTNKFWMQNTSSISEKLLKQRKLLQRHTLWIMVVKNL